MIICREIQEHVYCSKNHDEQSMSEDEMLTAASREAVQNEKYI